MDEIRLQVVSGKRDSCVAIVTETWLDENVPDTEVELADPSVYRVDRTAASVKRRGKGLALYVHNSWCMDTNIIKTHCSPDLEYLAVKCRPFKLVREFCAIIIVAVYIPPRADTKLALEYLYCLVSRQMNAHPEAAVIVAGDFNHVELKTVFPKFKKQTNFPTRENNILDQVYCNIPGAYRAVAAPHLGMSDHISVELLPAYTPVICRTKPTTRTVQVWSTIESILCLSVTVWYGSCTAKDRKDLARVVKTAQRIVGSPLPNLDSLYTSRLQKKARCIASDPTHPGYGLFVPLPSRKRSEVPTCLLIWDEFPDDPAIHPRINSHRVQANMRSSTGGCGRLFLGAGEGKAPAGHMILARSEGSQWCTAQGVVLRSASLMVKDTP
ncbi:hypothetical protein N1851_003535 [Merluccius polli]|uniref:Endonuclease/exonuclease/phosphatase domain-containing protein n=1 Tax=Merluccius polli TaxID=89951 RepID=A0AA47P814_MERPO|nr:hypothetical protein N1851_003535 [Merluccius polli]